MSMDSIVGLPTCQEGTLSCKADLHQCDDDHARNPSERNMRRVERSSTVADTVDARSIRA